MTRTQKKTARWVVVSLWAILAVLSGATLNSLPPAPAEAQPSGPDSPYVVFHIPNKTGAQVCGLNLAFAGLEVPASQALVRLNPFTRLTPTDEFNRVSLSGTCLKADEEVTLQLAGGIGMEATLHSYSWIKTGKGVTDLLIPGSFDGVFKDIVQPRQPIPVLPPMEDKVEPTLNTFTFEMAAMPRGRLLVALDMIIYEGQPVGIYDQEAQRQLSQQLNATGANPLAGLFADRQKLQQQLDALTIYAPFSGQIKGLTVETVGQISKVTLKLASLEAVKTMTTATINR